MFQEQAFRDNKGVYLVDFIYDNVRVSFVKMDGKVKESMRGSTFNIAITHPCVPVDILEQMQHRAGQIITVDIIRDR